MPEVVVRIVRVDRIWELGPRGADLFELHSTVTVHDVDCDLRLVARTVAKTKAAPRRTP